MYILISQLLILNDNYQNAKQSAVLRTCIASLCIQKEFPSSPSMNCMNSEDNKYNKNLDVYKVRELCRKERRLVWV